MRFSFFHDDLGSFELEQVLETVVAVDDPAVEVVEVGRRVAASLKRNHGAQGGRDDREDGHDHPLGTDAGFLHGTDKFEGGLSCALPAGWSRACSRPQPTRRELFQVYLLQQAPDRFRADARLEHVIVNFRSVFRLGAPVLEVLELPALIASSSGSSHTSDNVRCEVDDLLQLRQREAEHERDLRQHRAEEPDVGDRRGQLDVPHAFATHDGASHFDAQRSQMMPL